ncbi:MAG: hypothetical protein HN742_24040 [Lentisphaerae bacterium]|jgi:hypothetical protein|nr:hypothetical protein [Lentisphaerota bacterium]MBT5611542.1 hypothetical protein [Lentisphaerota bacterium]MBT7059569.1 hypothetical protein [Lentisphaerota bacterium]MBT7844969.1 hypothetical protein [Lentisphaerota bacterium]
MLLRTGLLTPLLFAVSAASAPDDGLIGYWPFTEGAGVFSADGGPYKAQAVLNRAGWATGDFGTAVSIGKLNSQAVIPNLPALDGSKEMTVSLWVYWNDLNGKYPNVLTGGWSPGGFMFFVSGNNLSFRLGRRGHAARRSGDEWKEGLWNMGQIPLKKWVHLTATFKLPAVTAYVDGKKIAQGTWQYPIGFTAPLVLGQWNTEKSHDGLIDEVRLYKRALNPSEVATLADRKGRDSGEIKILPVAEPEKLASFETRCATLAVNEAGCITSLLQKTGGKDVPERELLAAEAPMVALVLEDTRRVECYRMSVEGDVLTASFPGVEGHAKVRCEPKGEYLKLTPLEVTVPDVASFVFFNCTPGLRTYRGRFAGLVSDDDSGICLRALDLETSCSVAMQAQTSADLGLVGYSAGLAAGPRPELRPMLKAMAAGEDVPRSHHGGPWASESPMARLSYLFVQNGFTDTDSWIDLARRGGFGIIHFREGWFRTFGDYRPNVKNFPGGMDEMVATADKFHAAGLKLGLHTLSGCIRTQSPYITPVPSDELISLATYTIARDFGKDSDTLYVNELPIDKHSTVFTYHGATNAFRIGTELVQYTEVSREKPYCFRNCTRGAFGTKALDHPVGTKAEFLKQVYLAFYPIPGSKLMDTLSDDIAHVFNTCKADFLYFDGAEGMGVGYPDNFMRWITFRKFSRGCLNEASNWGHHNWWFHSRTGAWDSAHCAWKRFQDIHVANARRARKNDLLEPQMGWWALNGPGRRHRRQYLDETEYWMAKNLALDASMSLGGMNVTGVSANARAMDMLTVIGWYEQRRLANYFDKATLERVREPGKDVRLRLSDNGTWQFTPVEYLPHKAIMSKREAMQWTVNNPHGQQPFRARIEMLRSPRPPRPDNTSPILDFSDTSLINRRECSANVTQEFLIETADVKGGVRNLRIRAANGNNVSVGAWTSLGVHYEFPYRNIGGCTGVGLWVKGDGSGAVLNVQFRTDRKFGAAISEHYIDLDFTGWRYCELLFRERDSERAFGLKWPYVRGASYDLCHRDLNTSRVSEINLLLNRIPANGRTDVTIGPIVGTTAMRTTLEDIVLTVNGKRLVIPVGASSGDLLELEGPELGAHYDKHGSLLTHFQPRYPDGMPVLNTGVNPITFACAGSGVAPARATVSVVSLGKPFGTRAKEVDWSKLQYEYDMPRMITRFDGRDNSWTSVLRDEGEASPGDRATLDLDIAVERIGATEAVRDDKDAIVIDDCANPAAFLPSEQNDYSRFARDSESVGVAKGVTREVTAAPGRDRPDGAVLFTARSSRQSDTGWAAIGRKFPEPLDLSKIDSITLWLKGDGCGASFKMQFWDVNGTHHDLVTEVGFVGWQFIQLPVLESAIDWGKIEYVVYYYNNVPAAGKSACVIDEVKAHRLTRAQSVRPVLVVNGRETNMPVAIGRGQILRCREGKRWMLVEKGQPLSKGEFDSALPALRKGVNTLQLRCDKLKDADCRIAVSCAKVYEK